MLSCKFWKNGLEFGFGWSIPIHISLSFVIYAYVIIYVYIHKCNSCKWETKRLRSFSLICISSKQAVKPLFSIVIALQDYIHSNKLHIALKLKKGGGKWNNYPEEVFPNGTMEALC